MGKLEGKRSVGRPRCRWENRIKINLKKWDGNMDWVDLGQVTGYCECGNQRSGFIKCGEFLD